MSRHPCCQCDEEFSHDDLGECVACNGLVCFECMKHSGGPHECIDYVICLACHEGRESDRAEEAYREQKAREARSAKAKARYNTPEARAKRAAKKAENAKTQAEREEQRRKNMAADLAKLMAEFGMFR